MAYNVSWTDQISYLEGLHRSGWAYVMQYLMQLDTTSETAVLLDANVDRTFHWLKPDYIPYVKPWVGFIHHTFNTDFSDNNSVRLFENPNFLESLDHCKGLYVFSQYMSILLRGHLDARGYTSVKVQALVHPTELTGFPSWSKENFDANTNKMLVQVGAWLRDNYAIYRYNGPKSITLTDRPSVVLDKATLMGAKMEHYFKPTNFFQLFRDPKWKACDDTSISSSVSLTLDVVDSVTINGEYMVPDVPSDDTCADMCRDIMCRDSNVYLNKYVLGAIEFLKKIDTAVTILPQQDDMDYDLLLSRNIVFLPLIDAAAVNTLIECIARATPVLVTPVPAVLELLGPHYPLYLDLSTEENSNLSYANIIAAHTYLRQLDVTQMLSGTSFLQSITSGDIYQACANMP